MRQTAERILSGGLTILYSKCAEELAAAVGQRPRRGLHQPTSQQNSAQKDYRNLAAMLKAADAKLEFQIGVVVHDRSLAFSVPKEKNRLKHYLIRTQGRVLENGARNQAAGGTKGPLVYSRMNSLVN